MNVDEDFFFGKLRAGFIRTYVWQSAWDKGKYCTCLTETPAPMHSVINVDDEETILVRARGCV